MNKQQLKQLTMIVAYLDNDMIDCAARGLSALIRCAMTQKSKDALMNYAVKKNLVDHPEFII